MCCTARPAAHAAVCPVNVCPVIYAPCSLKIGAATCGVIETATAREQAGAAVAKPLTAETQGRILHYALLAASAGKSYDASIAAAVVIASCAFSAV